MEVECPRHQGACTIGCQLLDETAPLTGKSWQASHKPLAKRNEGSRHTDIIYKVETRKDGGRENNLETMLECRTALQQTQGIHPHVNNGRLLTAQVYKH